MSEKRCPFCGLQSDRAIRHMDNCFFAYLNDGDIEKALTVWNVRPLEDALRDEIVELKANLKVHGDFEDAMQSKLETIKKEIDILSIGPWPVTDNGVRLMHILNNLKKLLETE